MKLIIDSHLDLAWNAMSYDRDQLLSVEALRRSEARMTGKGRGRCTVSLPEMRRAGVGVCLATVLCRAMPGKLPGAGSQVGPIGRRGHGEFILRENLDHANQTIASAAARGQLTYYELLEQQAHLRMIRDVASLDDVWTQWSTGDQDRAPIGIILSMEGADPIVQIDQVEWWWQQGLRTACLAHYGPSAYAMGTGGDGPLTAQGRELVKAFDRVGVILDLVHTADTALAEALDSYGGPVFVSHGNCRALVEHDRQFSDAQIRRVAQRQGVFGVVLDCWMLDSSFKADDAKKSSVPLSTLADHIDHICQVTGAVAHVGIGSDLDGGFGTEETPTELDTIADLQKLAPLLASRGYSDGDIDRIFHGNWLAFFRNALPK